jgi:hypothetical protein
MFLIKLIFKLLALPIVAALTLLQWMGLFLTGFSSIIFNLLAGICFMLAITSYPMGICTGAEVIRILITGFVVYIIPHIANWFIERIATANLFLRHFIVS